MMQITVTRGIPGFEIRQRIAFDSDADALSEVWRVLVSESSADLLDVSWRRSDGVEFNLGDLQRWASAR